jgi:phosphonate transport system substrate-binding protein
MKKVASLLSMIVLTMNFAMSAYAEDTIRIGIAAMISPKDTINYYSDMIKYVGEKIGRKVDIVQHEDYSKMDSLLEKGIVSVAFICAGPYVKDHEKFGIELLVAPQSYGKPFYHAYIIVHKDSAIKNLTELRGKSFAFTDPKSNTGKLVPTYMIAKRFSSTPEKFFSNIIYSQTHDKSIEYVAKKIADGASVDSLIYDYAVKKNPEYAQLTRIVEKSPPYGIPPVVVNKDTPPQLKAALRDAFLNMHKDPRGKKILDGMMIDKFIIPKDADYNSVREMEEYVTSQNK